MTRKGEYGKGKGIDLLRSLVSYQGDDCVDWPYSKGIDGYGRLGFQKKIYTANRLMCILAHGEPPTPKHYAAHSCGNGHLGCVNPRHLSWKTVRENEADKREHGTAGGGRGSRTTLTMEQIADIRANKGIVPIRELARRHGLKFSGVRYWQASTHQPAPPGTSYWSVRQREKRQDQR